MLIEIAYSPCPNDCFIFDALVHEKIDTGNYRFKPVLEDVETLNRWAMKEKIPFTKLSYHALLYLLDTYLLLRSGSALGFNCGPILIANKEYKNPEKEISTVAIPGKYTTANFLLSIAYPGIKHKEEMLFSDIEGAVLQGKVDAGLIIHENRFTYQSKGLLKICDLGEYWENIIHAPIPLGCIAASRKQNPEIISDVEHLIRESVLYAFANPASSMNYVKEHAQEMSEEVIQKHIELYVNDFSVDIGEKGLLAFNLMTQKAKQIGLIK